MYEADYQLPMRAAGPLPFVLPAWIALAPFEEYLGMRIVSAADGRAELAMPFLVRLAQGWGLLHGGAVTALADTAVAIAMKTLLPEGSKFATTELALQFHAPVREGEVRALAVATWQGERELHGTAEVFDAAGVKVATFRSVFRVKR